MNDAKTPEAKTQCPKCGNLNLTDGVCWPCDNTLKLTTGIKVDTEARVELLEFGQGALGLISELLRLAGDYAEREGYTDCRVANSPNGYLITAKRKTNEVTPKDEDVFCATCGDRFSHKVGGTWFSGQWFCGVTHVSAWIKAHSKPEDS